jgi:hypothetical protein
MPDEELNQKSEGRNQLTISGLIAEKNHLLTELEVAYKNMEMILEQSNQEKEIVYHELQQKFDSLKKLYD